MYLKVKNGIVEKYPYNINDLRREYKNISFPKYIDENTLEKWQIYPVHRVEYPNVDHTKNVIEDTPVKKDGMWYQSYRIVDSTTDEIRERINNKKSDIRDKRNAFLQSSDWVIIKYTELGTNIPTEWKTYRQALRDITEHPNFPFLNEEDWPTKPVV